MGTPSQQTQFRSAFQQISSLDRLPNYAAQEAINVFQKNLAQYGGDWCTYQFASPVSIKEYDWDDLINKVSEGSIGWISKKYLRDVLDAAIKEGVYVQFGTGISMVDARRSCWRSETFPAIIWNTTKNYGVQPPIAEELVTIKKVNETKHNLSVRNESEKRENNSSSWEDLKWIQRKREDSQTLPSQYHTCQNLWVVSMRIWCNCLKVTKRLLTY